MVVTNPLYIIYFFLLFFSFGVVGRNNGLLGKVCICIVKKTLRFPGSNRVKIRWEGFQNSWKKMHTCKVRKVMGFPESNRVQVHWETSVSLEGMKRLNLTSRKGLLTLRI